MRQIILFALFLSATSTVVAQKNKVQSAIIFQKYGELDKAKEAIDAAAENPASNTMAKTWLYRGSIYYDIYNSEKFNNLAPDALKVAIESLTKCKELDTKNDYENEIREKQGKAFALLYNRGVELFQKKEYVKAVSNFELIHAAFPKDTNTIYNLALATEKGNMKEKSYVYLNKLVDMQFKNPAIFQMLSSNYKSDKDTVQALAILEKGRTLFPDNVSLIIDELNIYLSQGKQKEAITKMENAVKLDPKNHNLFFALGTAYDNLKNTAKAEENYRQAITVKPDYFDAYYNLGAMYFNDAANMANEANKIPVNETKKFEEAKKKFTDRFKQAQPFLEKAHELSPKDQNTLFSLKQLYAKIGNIEKSSEVNKKLQELKNSSN